METVLDATHEHLERIADVIDGMEDPFLAQGSISLNKPLELVYSSKKQESEIVQFPLALYINDNNSPLPARNALLSKEQNDQYYKNISRNPAFSKLLHNCDPSPFGLNHETIFDEKVRKASQISKERILSVGIDLEKLGVLDKIRRKLLPLKAGQITASLEKINVYGPGSFFTSHRDTPRDENCFGSLVVCLPSPFVGGALTVSTRQGSKKSTEVCNWDKILDPSESQFNSPVNQLNRSSSNVIESEEKPKFTLLTSHTKSICPWAAFFGDCEHEIRKVQYGCRITLSYILRHSDQSPSPLSLAPSAGPTAEKAVETEKESGESEVVVLTSIEKAKQSLQPNYDQCCKATLKNRCRLRGLPVGGRKDELVYRLQMADKDDDFKEFIPTAYPDDEAILRGMVISDELKAALLDPNFMPEGGYIGVPCVHLYEKDSDLPPANNDVAPTVTTKDFRLKGADSFIFVAAAHLLMYPRVVRIVTEDCCGDQWVLETWPSITEALQWTSTELIENSFIGRGLSYEDVGKGIEQKVVMQDGGEIDAEGLSSVEWCIPLKGSGIGGIRPPKSLLLTDIFISGTGYFGNESSNSTVYVNAAIVMQVPVVGEGVRVGVQAPASAYKDPRDELKVVEAEEKVEEKEEKSVITHDIEAPGTLMGVLEPSVFKGALKGAEKPVEEEQADWRYRHTKIPALKKQRVQNYNFGFGF